MPPRSGIEATPPAATPGSGRTLRASSGRGDVAPMELWPPGLVHHDHDHQGRTPGRDEAGEPGDILPRAVAAARVDLLRGAGLPARRVARNGRGPAGPAVDGHRLQHPPQ